MKHSHLINLNETAVRIHGGRNMTWGKADADGVWIDSAGGPKDCFTVLDGCSFDGSLLLLGFVAKRKTARCHHGFGDLGPHWIAHSEKGWMTGELLIRALGVTRELPHFADRAKMAVVIHQAPGHMTVAVAMGAAQLGMDLIPVPPGSTGKCQPIDVRVFGVLKRKLSRLDDCALRACSGRAWTKADAVRTIIEAWAEIEATVVKSAWRCALGEAEGV
jgi:hypothetical protein